MEDIFDNLFDIFTTVIVSEYDSQNRRRLQSHEGFQINQNIINNSRIVRDMISELQRTPRESLFEPIFQSQNIRSPIIDLFFDGASYLSSLNNEFSNFERQLQEEFENFEDVKVVLSKDEFNNNIKKLSDKERINELTTCNICLEQNIEETSVSLKCNHAFHNDCIKEWLTKQSTKCPNCRTECDRI